MKTYSLKIEANPPGFKRYSATLSQRNKGVVFEANGNTIKAVMIQVTDWLDEEWNGL